MNRYDLLLGKEPPSPLEYGKKMIIGERGSGKTSLLLRFFRENINLGYSVLFCTLGSQKDDIKWHLGEYYKPHRVCNWSNVLYKHRGIDVLFLDNIDNHFIVFYSILSSRPTSRTIITCDKDTFLSQFKLNHIPRSATLYGLNLELLDLEDIDWEKWE